MTIDSDIYVWKYEDGTDLAYFDGLGDTILSVALVKPKKASKTIVFNINVTLLGLICGLVAFRTFSSPTSNIFSC